MILLRKKGSHGVCVRGNVRGMQPQAASQALLNRFDAVVVYQVLPFWIRTIDRLQLYCDVCIVDGCGMCVMYAVIMIASVRTVIIGDLYIILHNQ